MSIHGRLLFISVYLLVCLGVIMAYSSSAIYADHFYSNTFHFLIRQIIFTVVGTIFLYWAATIPTTFWRKNSRKIIFLAILFMPLVFLPVIGYEAGGANRWINLKVIKFQPVELCKIAVCIYLSDYLSRKLKRIQGGNMSIFIPPLILIGVICGLSLLQPDLGSCAFIVLLTAIMFFLSGMKLIYAAIAGISFIPIFYFLVIKVPYRLSRVTAYLNPWEDSKGSGFQMIQSFIAFGVGGVKGTGLGESIQKLFYLPSSFNDFVFSIVGEELGLIGSVSVLILFGVIFYCGMAIAMKSLNIFEQFLAISLTLFIVLQALLNTMVATGLLPTKGLSLPFISYGGTSLVVNLIGVGLLLGIDVHRRR